MGKGRHCRQEHFLLLMHERSVQTGVSTQVSTGRAAWHLGGWCDGQRMRSPVPFPLPVEAYEGQWEERAGHLGVWGWVGESPRKLMNRNRVSGGGSILRPGLPRTWGLCQSRVWSEVGSSTPGRREEREGAKASPWGRLEGSLWGEVRVTTCTCTQQVLLTGA